MGAQTLTNIKVLDLGHHLAGPYCTKLLADFGAEVIKIERPDSGDPSRKIGPFPGDKPDPEKSGFFCYLNNNKKGITLNLKTETGRQLLKELVKTCDVLVENFEPRVMPSLGLAYQDLEPLNPGLVMVSISSFGQTGPYRDYKATDLTIQAISGVIHHMSPPETEPVRMGGRVAECLGGLQGAVCALAALAYRNITGVGQHIDVSIMQCLQLLRPASHYINSFVEGTIPTPARLFAVPGLEPCKDGHVGLFIISGDHWQKMCQMMGHADYGEDLTLAVSWNRIARKEEIYAWMHAWLAERTMAEVVESCRDWRLPVCIVSTTKSLSESEHLHFREFFMDVSYPELGQVIQPGVPFRMSETPGQIHRPAPLLGEHNEEVYGTLGYFREDLVRLSQQEIV